ncbi:MAG: cytochrome c [bacterium]
MCHRPMWHLMAVLALGLVGCQQTMREQDKVEPGEVSAHWPDGRGDRPAPLGAVAQGDPAPDPHRDRGRVDGASTDAFPFAITADDMQRGQTLYGVYCQPCHDPIGSGRGMVVRQGHPAAQSFHEARLRDAPAGYYVETIALGRGLMPPFGDRLAADDRWRVVAYIRALQRSQRVEVSALDAGERAALEAAP